MATGTVTYTGYPTSTMQIVGGQSSNIVTLNLSGSLAPSNATLTGATVTIKADVTSRALTFSPMVFGASGYYESLSDSAQFTGTGPRTETFELGFSSATATQLAYSGSSVSFRFQGGSGASGAIIFTVQTSYPVTIKFTYTLPDYMNAPTTATLDKTVAEAEPTLSWSGASGTTSNTITGYEIHYADSTNNTTWGSWATLKTITSTVTSGSTTVALPSVRGSYRKYRIRTMGSAGEAYYSGWKETVSVRKNTVPSGPSTVTAAPATYVDEAITVAWSGASGGTSPIKGYMLAKRDSTDGTTYGSWSVITTITLATSNGSRQVNLTTPTGTYTQFGVWTIDSLDCYSSESVSNAVYHGALTALGAPTSCTLSPSIVETSLTLTWAGASNSPGNAITGYTIQLSESSDGITWGNWQAFTVIDSTATSGSYAGINSPATRGAYRRFRIQTRGSAGADYYSDWMISNPAQKNTLPTVPTSFIASPASYYNTQVTLSWSGAVSGTSPIKSYVIQQSTSTDGTNWSAWSTLTTITSSSTSGSCAVTPSSVDGMRTRYRIAVVDTLDAVSGYTISNTIQRMSVPETPIVSAPHNNAITYNTTPRFLIKTGGVSDGRVQRVCVQIDNQPWQDNLNNPERFSVQGNLENGTALIYQAEPLQPGEHLVTIRCANDAGNSAEVMRSFTVQPDICESIIASKTTVKAAHMQSIRDAVNNVRRYYGMTPVIWSQSIMPHRTPVRDWPLHVKEIRAALEAIAATINTHDTVDIFDVPQSNWFPIIPSRPQADVMNQLLATLHLL
jgi:hypothetical protein